MSTDFIKGGKNDPFLSPPNKEVEGNEKIAKNIVSYGEYESISPERMECLIEEALNNKDAEKAVIQEELDRAKKDKEIAFNVGLEQAKEVSELREAEHKLSDAYIRIRTLLNAFDTPYAPTPEQIYELTERKLKSLTSKLHLAQEGLESIASITYATPIINTREIAQDTLKKIKEMG